MTIRMRNIRVPDEAWDRFKVACATRHISMQDAIAEALAMWAEDSERVELEYALPPKVPAPVEMRDFSPGIDKDLVFEDIEEALVEKAPKEQKPGLTWG